MLVQEFPELSLLCRELFLLITSKANALNPQPDKCPQL